MWLWQSSSLSLFPHSLSLTPPFPHPLSLTCCMAFCVGAPNSFSTKSLSLVCAAMINRSMALTLCFFSRFESTRASWMFVAPLITSFSMLEWFPASTAALSALSRHSGSKSSTLTCKNSVRLPPLVVTSFIISMMTEISFTWVKKLIYATINCETVCILTEDIN